MTACCSVIDYQSGGIVVTLIGCGLIVTYVMNVTFRQIKALSCVHSIIDNIVKHIAMSLQKY